MYFKRTLLKQFLTKILYTKPILTSHFEAIIHQQILIATAHHQLSGPITHQHWPSEDIVVDDPAFIEETAIDNPTSFQTDPTIDPVIPTIMQGDPTSRSYEQQQTRTKARWKNIVLDKTENFENTLISIIYTLMSFYIRIRIKFPHLYLP